MKVISALLACCLISACADLTPREKAVIGWSSALAIAIVASSTSKDHNQALVPVGFPVGDPNKPPCTKQPDGSCR